MARTSEARTGPAAPVPGGPETGRSSEPFRPTWRTKLYRLDTKYMPYILISPFFILFAIFGLFPIVMNGIVAFRTWRLDRPELDGWAGFANFERLLTDDRFYNALLNTLGIFFLATVPQLLFALIIASWLNRKLRLKTALRVAVLLPYITPITASTLVFAVLFARDSGTINWLLGVLSFDIIEPINWRATKWASWIAIATMVNWKWVGFNAIIYLAAMQSIPRDVYEAAAIDGAGQWRQLWRITVPMILPVVLFTVIISTIFGLQLFAEPLLFQTNPAQATGGNQGQFQTVAMLIYQTGWQRFNLGYAAAMSWALFALIIIVAIVNALVARRLAGRGVK